MGLESGTFVSELVSSNPVGATDGKAQGDDHLRLIKATLQNTFPNANRAFRFEEVPAAKTANYSVIAADQRKLIPFDATSGNLSADVIAIASLFPGWLVTIMKVDSSANTVTVNPNGAETVNGGSAYVIAEQYEFVTIMVQGSAFVIVGAGGAFPVLEAGSTIGSDIHGNAVPVGASMEWYSATPPTGWLLVNGDSVGSAASAATQNSDDYEDLFTHLWNALANAQAPVSGGRGASAAADWAANKTLTMPDERGRSVIGAGTGVLAENVTAGNVNISNDTFTVLSNVNRWVTGMKVQVSTDGVLPTGISAATDYFIIRDDATTVRLATTLANAIAGTDIDITAAGSGTHTLTHTLTARTTGEVGGEESHALVQTELPAARLFTAANVELSVSNASLPTVTNANQKAMLNDSGASRSYGFAGTATEATLARTSPMGSSAANNNMQPWVAKYKIIRY